MDRRYWIASIGKEIVASGFALYAGRVNGDWQW